MREDAADARERSIRTGLSRAGLTAGAWLVIEGGWSWREGRLSGPAYGPRRSLVVGNYADTHVGAIAKYGLPAGWAVHRAVKFLGGARNQVAAGFRVVDHPGRGPPRASGISRTFHVSFPLFSLGLAWQRS